MTNYEYAGEMQELCFKISQHFKAMGQDGLYEFYYATSTGFGLIREEMSVEEAEKIINRDQTETLENTAVFVTETEKRASAYLSREVTA